MDAISSYRGNRPTNKHTPPARPPQTGPITIDCAAKLSAKWQHDAHDNDVQQAELKLIDQDFKLKAFNCTKILTGQPIKCNSRLQHRKTTQE